MDYNKVPNETSESTETVPSYESNQQQSVGDNIGPEADYVQSTLDEPVSETVTRDLLKIYEKLKQVLLPSGDPEILKEWDLWGPLLLCLLLAISLGTSATDSTVVFNIVFVIIWLGSAVVTVNAQLLGAKLSFLQSVCVLGYCVAPLVVAELVCLFVDLMIVRVPIVVAAVLWSFIASNGFLTDSSFDDRRMLATFPIFLFYFVLGWIIVLPKSL